MNKLFYPLSLFLSIIIVPAVAQNKASDEIQKGIDVKLFDPSISPKTDFYQFVNGKWLEKTEIPADRSSWGNFDELGIRVNEDVLFALEKAQKEETYKEGTDQHKAITFYNLAMDTAYINSLEYEPLKPLLAQIQSIADMKSLQSYLQKATLQGLGGFFDFEVYPDFKNSQVNVLYIGPGKLGLPNKEYYTKTDEEAVVLRKKYKKHVQTMFQLVGYSPAEANLKADNVLLLETSLAESMLSEVEKRNPMMIFNKRSVSQLSEMTSTLNWKNYIASVGIDGVDSLIVFEPKHMEAVGEILSDKKIGSLKAYLEWQLINTSANFLSEDFVQAQHNFNGKILWGAEERKPRWETVLEVSNNNLGEAIGKVYVDEFFSPEDKEKAKEMVNNILEAFRERIKHLDWMSDETKKQAISKIEGFNVKIGYPDKWKDYSELVVKDRKQGGSYLENVIAASTWKFQEKIEKIGRAVDKTEWFIAPQTVNAYYSPIFNEIGFSAGMLQPPFFNSNADDAVNYGAIGAVIGHEISHGFDDIGSQFDATGNMKDWWRPEDRKAFEERKQQLVEQFNSYQPLPGIHVNGALTIGENIGDLGGISVAFDGLMRSFAKKGKPEAIDGLSPEQRFYISYVTLWRTKQKDEALKVALSNDPHSPGKFRAIGPLQNQESFHQAFDIEEGDAMYKPIEQRIKIW